MAARSFRIDLDCRGYGSVEIDGEKQTGVVAVSVESEIGKIPMVSVTYLASHVEVESLGEGEVN